MSEHAAGLFPVPGDGVLARHGDLILLCSLEDSQAADDLLDLLEQIAAVGGDGRRFAGAVADVLEAAERGPSVLAFGPARPGLAITVSGGAWADIATADGTARVEAGHPRMLLRGTIRSVVSGVRGGLSPSDVGAASTDRFSRLDAGTVRAGGLSFYSDGTTQGRGAGAGRGDRRPGGAGIPPDQMTPSDISGAQTSAMEIPRARGRGTGGAAAAAAAGAAAGNRAGQGGQDRGAPEGDEPAADQPADQEAAATSADDGAAEAASHAAAVAEGAGAEVPQEEPSVWDAASAPGSLAPSSQAPEQEAQFEPTAAWGAPEPSPAQERQATELWSAPDASSGPGEPSPAERAGTAVGWQPPGPGQSAAADLERDVTAPPEPYEPVTGFSQEQGQPFEAVMLLDAGANSGVELPAREPLSKVKDMPPGSSSYVSAGPIIQGVYCKNGHFDDPEALFCAICGISMNQQTLVPRPGERPPLGVLLLDDGSVFQLDSDYVIGREPGLDASVAAGQARPLRVADDTGIVSRVHARVHLDGWRVLVADLGSANGTRVLLPGQQADQPLVPQVPIVLATGSQVDLGGRGFRYESHRGR
ncbi:MAG TPA: FHA domain-containing protein [Streptosporangiaceae bacterium]|nr:FHA domain-containing protein [Streptosporangiaceae bacterium]